MSFAAIALVALGVQAAPTKRDGVIKVPGFSSPNATIEVPGLASGVTTTFSPESALSVIQSNTASVAQAIGTGSLLNAEAAFVLAEARTVVAPTQTQLSVYIDYVAGTPVVEVSSIGGSAITLATGTATGAVTSFAGHTFTVAPKSNTVLMDAISIAALPGDPNDDSYQDAAPDSPYPFISLVGGVSSSTDSPTGPRSFILRVCERVRDEQKESHLMCIIPGNSPRWTNVHAPALNTLVYVLGRCAEIRADGQLRIQVEHVVFNLAPPSPSSESAAAPGSKRRKYNAFVPSVPSVPVYLSPARLRSNPLLISDLFNHLLRQFKFLDMFSRHLEWSRLQYIRANQLRLQQEDAEQMGVDTVEPNDNVYLPASFLGSNRWASEQIADSLAIAAMYGPPTFFITMTCNTSWPEITSQLASGQQFHDIPVVVCRVFKQKLALLEHCLRTMFPNAGRLLYLIHSIEFQKRGLPHAHILVKYTSDCVAPSDIDDVISAEIPSDPDDARLVCPDRARFRVDTNERNTMHVDEIEEYWNGRYLSAAEATWRIMGFNITKKDPAVSSLPIHLPTFTFRHRQFSHSNGTHTESLSPLERYFIRPSGSFDDPTTGARTFDSLTYTEFFTLFRLEKKTDSRINRPGVFLELQQTMFPMLVVQRASTHTHIARIQPARPSEGERFYLRTIALHRPFRSFEDARTVDNFTFPTFQDAANALGLFAHENEGQLALAEAVSSLYTPRQLRLLFIHLLVNDCILSPHSLWNSHRDSLSHDFTLHHHCDSALGFNDALQELSHLLEEYGRSLSEFGLPQPSIVSTEVQHELERWAPLRQQMQLSSETSFAALNAEQKLIADAILEAVLNCKPFLAFIDGPAGRGKTFLINAIADYCRARNHIVITTATSAYAAQLYHGGRTTHSAFKVPVNDNNELLQSTISSYSSRADLIRAARLIVWDEAPTANSAVLACVEEVCRRVMSNNLPFGGKVFILLGDFRQTCPVIRHGTRAQAVQASIKSSPLWDLFSVLKLTIPIRNAEDPEFAAFVDNIGDGLIQEPDLDMVDKVTAAEDVIDFTYPPHILLDPPACLHRAILAPTNAQIDAYNDEIVSRLPGHEQTYFAADSLKEATEVGMQSPDGILDYVARQTPPGLPPHALTVKVNGVYRLLRNFSIDRGLVKNTRVIIVNLGRRLITVRILHDQLNHHDHSSTDILLPRISFSTSLPSGHTLLRRQFPLAPAYATTFNSCQGLTLDTIANSDIVHYSPRKTLDPVPHAQAPERSEAALVSVYQDHWQPARLQYWVALNATVFKYAAMPTLL
ncbi:hypothetical protein ACG7TL_000048 [Trametes sanguinea]